MMERNPKAPSSGTAADLIEAAELGARIATRARVARGEDADTIRRGVVGRFLEELEEESHGVFADETLVASVQRAVESGLSAVAWAVPRAMRQ
jgi:hypothetical protein